MTMKGEAENKPRFNAIITALKGDYFPATLKVSVFLLNYYINKQYKSSSNEEREFNINKKCFLELNYCCCV